MVLQLVWIKCFYARWGVDTTIERAGGVKDMNPKFEESKREIYLLQRRAKLGKGLGKTTGWIHRTNLKKKNVKMISGVSYKRITEQGLKLFWMESQSC